MEAHVPFLIVGLGNPGREFKLTRHNIGFMVIDQLCKDHQIRLSRMQSKALVGSSILAGHKTILAKPYTYMNLSGNSVGGLMNFYKVGLANLIVVHDDLDLPLGTLRLRPDGGSGGQRGLASIIERLGTDKFARLRLGIGRPPGRMDPADYVLTRFSASEWQTVLLVLEQAAAAVGEFLEFGLETAMNRFNGRIEGGD
ncbi:MAG: aminoacyl-tRNA hydrolase [Anaerolineae bacterium]|nr:aminoacyl-tRNA hydrolase [Anaerolineae bacterium]